MNIFRTNKGLIDHCVGGFWWGIGIYWTSLVFSSHMLMFFGIMTGILLGLAYEIYQWINYKGDNYGALFLDSVEDFMGEVATGFLAVFIGWCARLAFPLYLDEIFLVLMLACSAWLAYSWFFRWRK